MAESEEELKSLLMKVKEESEKAGLELNIQKTNIMASGLIIPWQIDEEKVETMTNFPFLGSKITVDHDCSQEIMYLVFSIYSIMSFANSDNFASSFPTWIPFSFSCLIAVATTSNIMLNKSGRSRYPCLLLNLKEKISAFHC